MSTHTNPLGASTIEALAFASGKGVTADDFKRFCQSVTKDAKSVSDGIVAALQKAGKTATAKQADGKWQIVVGTAAAQFAAQADAPDAPDAPDTITVNITVAASTADLPAVIGALNTFFGNWRPVLGLIATGAAVVGGALLMSVKLQS